jgi:hypothetical protein
MNSVMEDYKAAKLDLEDLLEEYASRIAQGMPVNRKQVRMLEIHY